MQKKFLTVWFEKEKLDYDEIMKLEVTENHKFYLNDGREIEARNLKIGDRLITTKYPSGKTETFFVAQIDNNNKNNE